MEVISHTDSQKWDEVVKSFDDYDIYYLNGYTDGFKLHGDGEPCLFYYNSRSLRAICVVMLRDISNDLSFKGLIPAETYYDAITPYGYGGFIFQGTISDENLDEFWTDYNQELSKRNIISVFYRFHPILKNAHQLDRYINVVDLGKTINIDLTNREDIWDNFTGKNRTSIRKAIKNGIEIKHGDGITLLSKFREIYDSTMDHDHATSYYYFAPEFYNSIDSKLKGNYQLFYATYNGEIISIAIMLYANKQMHYHLSGSIYEYRSISPSNLLLFEAACWGAEHGFQTFHLGGGVGSGEDPLFKFKQAFNKKSTNQFSIGKDIVDKQSYDYLVNIRVKNSDSFDPNNQFFPLYRS